MVSKYYSAEDGRKFNKSMKKECTIKLIHSCRKAPGPDIYDTNNTAITVIQQKIGCFFVNARIAGIKDKISEIKSKLEKETKVELK